MAGQIEHRELVGAIGRTCAVSGPQRASAARKCTIRALLAPPAGTSLLGRPFGRAEGTIRRRQDDLLGAEPLFLDLLKDIGRRARCLRPRAVGALF